uniref:Uncharacterized protein n=1 Tax=Arundo donax TaxID=35708 RepID=A0A0A9CU53_ARUDO
MSGTRVAGSTACAASSIITTSKARVIRLKIDDPLKLRVENTMAASSSIDALIRSYSPAPRLPPSNVRSTPESFCCIR